MAPLLGRQTVHRKSAGRLPPPARILRLAHPRTRSAPRRPSRPQTPHRTPSIRQGNERPPRMGREPATGRCKAHFRRRLRKRLPHIRREDFPRVRSVRPGKISRVGIVQLFLFVRSQLLFDTGLHGGDPMDIARFRHPHDIPIRYRQRTQPRIPHPLAGSLLGAQKRRIA